MTFMPGQMWRTLTLHDDDHVALALDDLPPGVIINEHGLKTIAAIPSGHKVCVRRAPSGSPILKYGQVIGIAMEDIEVGAHVHVHNVYANAIAVGNVPRSPSLPAKKRTEVFQGYLRSDGAVGTRNYIGVLTSVNCSATVVTQIAAAFPSLPDGVDGIVPITHTTGCGMATEGEAMDILRRTLGGYARHPNFAAVLIVGLGCEANQIDRLLDDQKLTRSARLETLTIQDAGGTRAAIERGREIVSSLIDDAADAKRKPVSAAHLTLGLQCGASDGWSGVTANPALGRAADKLVAAGGTIVLSETPEIYGAEQLLFARAKDEHVRAALQERLDWWQAYVARHSGALNNNPSPGNVKGGLTTILEKSLGAVAKSGTSPLNAVYQYGESISERGFVFMDSPGYDPCSATGQMASGANILAFTTGRGSVFGSKPAPCIKLASNIRLAGIMSEDMDVDCSPVLDGRDLDEMGEEIFQMLLSVASGEKSASEELGFGDLEFVPWQMGAVM